MDDFSREWFKWLEEGIETLSIDNKEKVYRNCGRHCAVSGVVESYKKLFIDSSKDLDTMFSRLDELGDVSGKVIFPGKEYEIVFPHCLCDLNKSGYINSDTHCECSRQSIIYVMETLCPEERIKVDKISTVLGGSSECRFSIKIE